MVDLFTPRATPMKESGITIKRTEKEFITILTVHFMRVSGNRIFSMDLAGRNGLTGQFTKGTISKE